MRVTYHDRDIDHEEVKLILGACRPRERALFAILAQSGLRSFTICSPRLKHVKEDLISNRIPCKIHAPVELAKGKYRGYFTFVSNEAVEYLKVYLHTRRRKTLRNSGVSQPTITQADYEKRKKKKFKRRRNTHANP